MLPKTWLYNYDKSHDYFSADIIDMIVEQGKTCISVIVPTHRVGQGRQADRIEIQKAIATARKQIAPESAPLFGALIDLFLGIDYTHNKEGIGLFVSPSIKKVIKFPFPVRNRIVINKFFYLQELLYTENYCVKYYVLDISKKEIHLFCGLLDRLEEIKEDNFPMNLSEEYEYSKPSHSRTDAGYAHVKNFEKDKSILKQIRLKKIFQEVDKAIGNYLYSKAIPLLICGPEEDIAIFKSTTKHMANIVGSMSDNYRGLQSHDLALMAWLQIRSFIDEKKLELVNQLKEKGAQRSVVIGSEEVWKRFKYEKRATLLLEKDFENHDSGQDRNMALQPSNGKYVSSPDGINEIITTVLRQNGKIIVLEKDTLEHCGINGKMVLVTN